MTVSKIFESFSVSHCQIVPDTSAYFEAVASATTNDFYGVRAGSLEIDTGQYDNTGDDSILSSWEWFNKGTLTITQGYINMELLVTLAGETISSSGSGASLQYTVPLWSDKQINVGAKPVIIACPAKDTDGTLRKLIIGLYKVIFGPMKIEGPSYKEGLAVSWTGTAVRSTVDEKGAALGTPAVGKLLYVQSA